MKNSLYALLFFGIVGGCYLFVDPFLAYWCHGEIQGDVATFFQVITHVGDSVWYLVGFALSYLLFRFWKKNDHLAFISAFFWGSVVVSGLTADIIKWIAGRFRPRMLFEHHAYGFDFFHIKHTMTSFPSGHSATVFALATAVMILFPKYRYIAFFIAFFVALSRVMITAHFLSDVIVGGVIGSVCVILLARHPKVAPNITYGKITP